MPVFAAFCIAIELPPAISRVSTLRAGTVEIARACNAMPQLLLTRPPSAETT